MKADGLLRLAWDENFKRAYYKGKGNFPFGAMSMWVFNMFAKGKAGKGKDMDAAWGNDNSKGILGLFPNGKGEGVGKGWGKFGKGNAKDTGKLY